MKKTFKLAFTEIGKLFLRPSIFVLTALLIIALILANFFFSPAPTKSYLSYEGTSVQMVYNEFNNDYSNILKPLNDAKAQIYNYIGSNDKAAELTSHIESTKNYFETTFYNQIIALSTSHSNSDLNLAKTVTTELRNKVSNFISYLNNNIKDNKINFYLTKNNFNTMVNFSQSFYDDLPMNLSQYGVKDYIHLNNFLRGKYDFNKLIKISTGFEKIVIAPSIYNELINTYYTNVIDFATNKPKDKTKLNDLYQDIYNFANENQSSNKQEDINALNLRIAKFNSFITNYTNILNNQFELYKIGKKTDQEISNLIGFESTSAYATRETITKCKYYIENEKYDFEFLNTFNFNQMSGINANCYDFCIFTMQILTVLIIIFTIFYACSSIAGEQSSGTLKMVAIRPYTRNKLFIGKFLACTLFALMLLLISIVASFIVGAISYGVTMQNVLVVFNSTKVILMNPFLLLLIYLASNLLNIIFFVALGMMLSLLFNNNVLSVFVTSIVYVTGILLNAFASGAFLKYIPLSHLDLYKFLGSSNKGFLSFNVIPDINFFVGIGIIVAMILVFNIISQLIFNHKEIK